MSFRVCLVDPPLPQLINRDMYSSTISKGGYKWPAADLLVLSGILKELTSEVSLLDANAEGLDIEQTLSRIDRFSPTHLVFMLGASAFQEDFSFVKAAKDRFPGLITIGSGGLLYHDGRFCLENHPSVDAIVNNFTTRDVIRYLVGDLDQLRNFTYRNQNDEIIETASDFHRDDYSHRLPCHEQLPLTGYKLSHVKYLPLTSVLTSYGCPARCSYCVTERINYRPRQVENVLEELRYVKSLGDSDGFLPRSNLSRGEEDWNGASRTDDSRETGAVLGGGHPGSLCNQGDGTADCRIGWSLFAFRRGVGESRNLGKVQQRGHHRSGAKRFLIVSETQHSNGRILHIGSSRRDGTYGSANHRLRYRA